MSSSIVRSDGGENPLAHQRLDKWLWVARFFKTRTLAADAISGGKVQVGDSRVKPAKLVRVGDRVRVRRGTQDWEVILKGFSKQRRPAKEAVLLYEETPKSIAHRQQEAERSRMERTARMRGMGRPTKKARRRYSELVER